MNLLKSLSNSVSIYFLEVMETPEDQCVKSVQGPDVYLVNPMENFSFCLLTIFAKKLHCRCSAGL